MKELIKKLFGCWHNYREVEGTDWFITYQCRKCNQRYTIENI
jgi:hypothetical protein